MIYPVDSVIHLLNNRGKGASAKRGTLGPRKMFVSLVSLASSLPDFMVELETKDKRGNLGKQKVRGWEKIICIHRTINQLNSHQSSHGRFLLIRRQKRWQKIDPSHIEFRCKMDKDTNVDNTTMTSLGPKTLLRTANQAYQNKLHSEPEEKNKADRVT